MRIFRYSTDGFEPKIQTHHYQILKKLLEPQDYSGLNQFQINLIKKQEIESKKLLSNFNFQDWYEGVFVFVGKLPDQKGIDHELNHLKIEERNARILWQAEIQDSAEVYSPYNLIPTLQTIGNYFHQLAAFVPKRSLSLITNIQNT